MSADKCYSRDGETYTEDFEAVLDDFDEYGDLEVGAVYYEADKVERKAGWFARAPAETIKDMIRDCAWDEADEIAKDFAYALPEKLWAELDALIKDWLDANVPVNFWTVANVRECKITAADIAGYMDEAIDMTPEPCWCDKQGIGEPGVSCGDCPTRDYLPIKADTIDTSPERVESKPENQHDDPLASCGWSGCPHGAECVHAHPSGAPAHSKSEYKRRVAMDDPLTRLVRLSEEIGGLYDDDADGVKGGEHG